MQPCLMSKRLVVSVDMAIRHWHSHHPAVYIIDTVENTEEQFTIPGQGKIHSISDPSCSHWETDL